MATDDREVMEARGAGESCPALSKVPADSTPEGKPKASLDAEPPKLELPTLEENGICEDRDCPGPPKSLSPKSGPTTKGQAGDGPGPEPMQPPLPLETEHHNAMELEKVRMEFELTRLKYLHQENERQRQHEEVMEQLQQQQQALPRQFSGGLQDLLLPQNQFAMFLYCFIFIHIIYVAKEMVFFLFSKHYLFCLAAILLCLIKTLWSYFQVPLLLPSPTMPSARTGETLESPIQNLHEYSPRAFSVAQRQMQKLQAAGQQGTKRIPVWEKRQVGKRCQPAHKDHLLLTPQEDTVLVAGNWGDVGA